MKVQPVSNEHHALLRIEELLERIAEVIAPTPEQAEEQAFQRSKAVIKSSPPSRPSWRWEDPA
jgi:hypothetical protein